MRCPSPPLRQLTTIDGQQNLLAPLLLARGVSRQLSFAHLHQLQQTRGYPPTQATIQHHLLQTRLLSSFWSHAPFAPRTARTPPLPLPSHLIPHRRLPDRSQSLRPSEGPQSFSEVLGAPSPSSNTSQVPVHWSGAHLLPSVCPSPAESLLLKYGYGRPTTAFQPFTEFPFSMQSLSWLCLCLAESQTSIRQHSDRVCARLSR